MLLSALSRHLSASAKLQLALPFYAAVCSKKSSISFTSLSLRWNSPARITPSACRAFLAPTIAPVTAGFRSVQAIETSPGERP
jgi:hypothetical protein